MNETKRLIKNTGFLAIGNLGAKIAAFVLLPLYTSILSTSDYGTYDYIVALNAFLLPVISLCILEAMFRFVIDTGNEGEDYQRTVTNAFVVVIANIVLLLILFCILHFTIVFEYLWWLLLYNVACVLYTFAVYLLRGMGRMKEYATIEGAKNIAQILLNVFSIVVLRWGLYGLILSMCISELVSVVVVFFRVKFFRQLKFRLVSMPLLKTMLTYALPLVPNSVCTQIINLSDRVMISGFLGSGPNGVYSVSYKFPNIVETLFHFFTNAWGESASRALKDDREHITLFYNKLYREINNFVFSLVLLMTSGMPILFRIFVRGDYIIGVIYVPILLFAMYFDCIGKFFAGIFTALKMTKNMATTTAVAAIINLSVDFLLIKYIGLYAAAISTLLAEIVLCIMRWRYLNREMNIKIGIKQYCIEIMVFATVYMLFDYNSIPKIVCSICVAVVYSIVANKELIRIVWKYLSSKKSNNN